VPGSAVAPLATSVDIASARQSAWLHRRNAFSAGFQPAAYPISQGQGTAFSIVVLWVIFI